MQNRVTSQNNFFPDNLDQEDCNNLFKLIQEKLPTQDDEIQDDYNNLFRFIKKNTTLRKAIAKISESSNDLEKANQLLVAIQKGDFTSSVFDDDRVDVFLLYLIKEQKIDPNNMALNFASGMTVYLHILALRQYGNLSLISCWAKNLQDIGNSAESSINKKYDVKMEIFSFYRDGKLTAEGEAYIKNLRKALHDETKGQATDLEIELDIQHFSNYIATLPPVEQTLTKLTDINASPFLYIVATNFPFIYPEWSKSERNEQFTAYVPSVSVLNYLMSTIFLKPVKFEFCFSLSGLDKLYNSHAKRLHPCSLSSPLIKSNPIAHQSKDAFAIPLHDFLHAFLGSLLSDREYQFLFKCFIPKLGEWKKLVDLHDGLGSQNFADAILRLSELNLTNIHWGYVDSCHRFENFLKFSLGLRDSNGSESTIGFRNGLFILLAAAYFNNVGLEYENNWFQFFAGELYLFLIRMHDKPLSNYRELARAILIVCSRDPNIVEKLKTEFESNALWQLSPTEGYIDFACDQLKRKSTMDLDGAMDLLLKSTRELEIPNYLINYILKENQSKLLNNNTCTFFQKQKQQQSNFRFWTQQPVNANLPDNNMLNIEANDAKQSSNAPKGPAFS